MKTNDYRERYEVDHRSYAHSLGSCEIGAWNPGTHDLCNTGAVFYQVSYQAIEELVILWVRDIVKQPMKWKIISAYLKGLSKYRRMVFSFLKYLFSF